MCQSKSVLSAQLLTCSVLMMALTALPAQFVTAQTGEGSSPKVINVEVRIDQSKTGQDRCAIEPENLQIPTGISNVTWSLVVQSPGARSGSTETRLDNVDFSLSLPVTASERLDEQRWRVTFDREQAFPETPYDVLVEEANGMVTECYPHVAGSTDQGGG